MEFEYNEEKNQELLKLRGISFEEIIEAINSGKLVKVYDHPNQNRYPGQSKMDVLIEDYIYCVPCRIYEDRIFMKTAFPDRKATKKYRGEK